MKNQNDSSGPFRLTSHSTWYSSARHINNLWSTNITRHELDIRRCWTFKYCSCSTSQVKVKLGGGDVVRDSSCTLSCWTHSSGKRTTQWRHFEAAADSHETRSRENRIRLESSPETAFRNKVDDLMWQIYLTCCFDSFSESRLLSEICWQCGVSSGWKWSKKHGSQDLKFEIEKRWGGKAGWGWKENVGEKSLFFFSFHFWFSRFFPPSSCDGSSWWGRERDVKKKFHCRHRLPPNITYHALMQTKILSRLPSPQDSSSSSPQDAMNWIEIAGESMKLRMEIQCTTPCCTSLSTQPSSLRRQPRKITGLKVLERRTENYQSFARILLEN